MKVIAVEEHFAPANLPGTASKQGGDLMAGTHMGSVWQNDPTTIIEIGPKRIAHMDEDGIDVQIISTPLAQNFPPEVAVDLCQKINDYLAEKIMEHPDRFKGYAALPTAVPEACADELEFCVKRIGVDRILFSLDYPFSNPDGMEKILEHPILSQSDREAVAYRNAERLFRI